MQPDLEQLDLNMEDNEGIQETKEDMKLGKLQFSLDYDFQKGEVDDDNLTHYCITFLKMGKMAYFTSTFAIRNLM